MDKKKIKKAIKSLEKRKKEHMEKLKEYEGENFVLKEYWRKEIKRFEEWIKDLEEKLNNK